MKKKTMEKRGQTTLFIIIGIVVVIFVVLYFVAVKQEIIPPLLERGNAATELAAIDEQVTECLADLGSQYVTIIGAQGGYIAPASETYRLYNDTQVSYLCWNQEGVATCTNRLLTLSRMEEQLEDVVDDALETCINVYDISDDVEAAEEWVLEVEIQPSSVDLTLDYPVTVRKGDDVASEDTFEESIVVPLGELYDVSQDIVNGHAADGDFDHLLYMLQKTSKYTIYKYKPYPDVIYQVKLREGTYVFQFAIQGEENV